MGSENKPLDPKGCYQDDDGLFRWNSNAEGSAHSGFKLVCQTKGHYMQGATGWKDCPSGSRIMTEAECEKAAADLGLTFSTVSLPDYLPGCSRDEFANRLLYNVESGGFSGIAHVVCITEEASSLDKAISDLQKNTFVVPMAAPAGTDPSADTSSDTRANAVGLR